MKEAVPARDFGGCPGVPAIWATFPVDVRLMGRPAGWKSGADPARERQQCRPRNREGLSRARRTECPPVPRIDVHIGAPRRRGRPTSFQREPNQTTSSHPPFWCRLPSSLSELGHKHPYHPVAAIIDPFRCISDALPSKGASPNVNTEPLADATQYPPPSEVVKIVVAGFEAPTEPVGSPRFEASPKASTTPLAKRIQ